MTRAHVALAGRILWRLAVLYLLCVIVGLLVQITRNTWTEEDAWVPTFTAAS